VEKAAYHRNPEAYRESRMKSYRKLKGETEKKGGIPSLYFPLTLPEQRA